MTAVDTHVLRDVFPAPQSAAPRQYRYECTCGWSLDAIADVDGNAPSQRCCECGGVAVRRVVEVAP